jgi:hypothetical protein
MSIYDDRYSRRSASARAARPDDVDQIAVVVDWLDACRNSDLAALLDLYAEDATLECQCGGRSVNAGRAELESYWRPRLDKLAPTAFGLEDIMPIVGGVLLDYLDNRGGPVRVAFSFTADGKIRRSDCLPAPSVKPRSYKVS